MRFFYTLLIFLITTSLFSQKILKVLFIGNSYTSVNNLPLLVSQIATSQGDSVYFDSSTPGGYTFQQHSVYAATLQKIQSTKWNYVVLQEQSQRPAFPPEQVQAEVYPYADSLVKYIRQNDSCTKVIFYMTWGRKNGDAANCQYYPPICTYEGMQQRLRESYLEMATNLQAEVAPAGMAWKRARLFFPEIELYSADESHPTMAGSYLTACIFYSAIFHKSSAGAIAPTSITSQIANTLQQCSDSVLFDSLQTWMIDTATTIAAFNYSSANTTCMFTNTSLNATLYTWDFGDGTQSTLTNPTHTFAENGTYTVSLIAENKCHSDTTKTIIEINTSSNQQIISSEVQIINSGLNYLLVNFTDPNEFIIDCEIVSMYGSIFKQLFIDTGANIIKPQNLLPGMYLCKLKTNKSDYTAKIVLIH